MKWPLRGTAFTNEVGEALRPIIGKYATLSWAPALLYIGADIYDKYKNDQTEYSPDSRRCLKQACFQGLASVFLPILAVKGGQNLFSLLGLITDKKITYNAQEQINKLAQQFIANGKLHAFNNNKTECVKEFIDIVSNTLDYKQQEEFISNPIKRFFKNHKINKKVNLDRYAKEIITDAIDARVQLLEDSAEIKETSLYKNYKLSLNSDQTKNVAVKSSLIKNIESKLMKGRFVKTLGGFAALAVAIKPIDMFVEEVLIGKVIGPTLNKNKPTI
jgi:hypothetical protein